MDIAEAKEKLDSYLKDAMQPEGWWSYKEGNGPSMEATAWCAFALADQDGAISQKASNYIIGEQRDDGGDIAQNYITNRS